MMTRRWTDTDLEFLSNNAGIMNHNQLSSALGRSINAIKLAQTRHGIRFIDNIYSYSTLAKEIGRSRRILVKWYKRGWLVGRRASWKARGKEPMIFREEDIVSFLKEHYGLFNPRKIPNRYFANIVSSCQGV